MRFAIGEEMLMPLILATHLCGTCHLRSVAIHGLGLRDRTQPFLTNEYSRETELAWVDTWVQLRLTRQTFRLTRLRASSHARNVAGCDTCIASSDETVTRNYTASAASTAPLALRAGHLHNFLHPLHGGVFHY